MESALPNKKFTSSELIIDESNNDNEKISEQSNSLFYKFRNSKKLLVLVVFVATFIDGIYYGVFVPLVPIYQEFLQVSDAWIGVLFGVYALNMLWITPLVGYFADRFGRKPVMIVGLVIQAVSTIAFIFGNNYWVLLISRCFQGFSSAITWVSGSALIADSFPSNEQGAKLGLVLTGTGLGLLCGPLIGGSLYQITHEKSSPFWVALAFIMLDGFARLIIVEPPKTPLPPGKTSLIILKEEKIDILMVLMFFASMGLTGLEPTAPLYMNDYFDLSPFFIGLYYGLIVLFYSFGSPLVGYISDKFPHRRVVILCIGSVSMSVSMAALTLITEVWYMVIIFILIGFSTALVYNPILPEVNSIIERKYAGAFFGTVSAFANFSWSAGGIVGPIFFSVMIEQISYFGATLVYGSLFLFCVILASLRLFIFSPKESNSERFGLINDEENSIKEVDIEKEKVQV